MKFTKYEKYGAYHWRQYEKGTKYKAHADRIKEWVKEKNTIDIGAGDGLITSLLGIQGIDDNEVAVSLAQKKGANVTLGNAYRTIFSDEQFDSVLMVDVIEHFDDPKTALLEAKRIMKKYLYIVTPEIGMTVPMDKFHVQEWTRNGLVDFVGSLGFTLEDLLVVPEEKSMYAKFSK